ncbi:MAG: hypothetical protein ABI616_06450 [Pseudomonadota bacterium]
MSRTTARGRLLLTLVTLALAGCASTSKEVAQPPIAQSVPEIAPEVTRHRPTSLQVDDLLAEHASAPPPVGFEDYIDYAHDGVFAWTQGIVEGTDHRFADKTKDLDPVPAAPFRVGLSVESVDRSDGLDLSLDAEFDIQLKLPNIQKRLSLFVTSDTLDEAPREAGEDTNLSAGLRYALFENLDFDVGVKFEIRPVAFTSLKWKNDYKLGKWDFHPYIKLFLESDDGLGLSSAATFDRWWGRELFRTSSYGKWLVDSNKVKWTQSLVYAHVSEQLELRSSAQYAEGRDIGRGWGARLLAEAEQTGAVTYYEAGVFFRWPSKSHWLFWYVEPLVRWDRDYNWSGDAGIRIGVDALFWDLARSGKSE